MNIEFPKTDIIGCRFPTNVGQRNQRLQVDNTTKEYFYRVLPGTEPKVGDLAIVACINGFQVAVVTSLNALYERDDLAYALGFVDPEKYNTYQENQAKKKLLKSKMDRMRKELEDLVTLDLLAEKSPEFKELLEAYRKL